MLTTDGEDNKMNAHELSGLLLAVKGLTGNSSQAKTAAFAWDDGDAWDWDGGWDFDGWDGDGWDGWDGDI